MDRVLRARRELIEAADDLKKHQEQYFFAASEVMRDNKKIGIWYREYRESRAKSLRKASILLGISAAYLSDIERGNRSPSSVIIKKMLTIEL